LQASYEERRGVEELPIYIGWMKGERAWGESMGREHGVNARHHLATGLASPRPKASKIYFMQFFQAYSWNG
jgi:hypothetical protein